MIEFDSSLTFGCRDWDWLEIDFFEKTWDWETIQFFEKTRDWLEIDFSEKLEIGKWLSLKKN